MPAVALPGGTHDAGRVLPFTVAPALQVPHAWLRLFARTTQIDRNWGLG